MTTTLALQDTIRAYMPRVELTQGLGTDAQHACTIAAINLALSGRLTDETPDCADEALCRWVILVQDAMPAEMLEAGDEHGDRWRALIPCIAGTRDDGRRPRGRLLARADNGAVVVRAPELAAPLEVALAGAVLRNVAPIRHRRLRGA